MSEQTVDLDTLFLELEEIKNQRQALDSAEEKVYHQMRQQGKTFTHEGQWYQIAGRFSRKVGRKVLYLKHLPGNPKAYLGASRNKVILVHHLPDGSQTQETISKKEYEARQKGEVDDSESTELNSSDSDTEIVFG